MQFDVVVIGGGPGGYVAAIRAAQKGMKAALVEARELGGTCLNRGCIPTKALMHATDILREAQNAEALGVTFGSISCDFARMHLRKTQVVATLRDGVAGLLHANGVQVFAGRATVTAPGTVQVCGANGEKEQLQTKNILVATGSVPAMLPLEGMNLPGVVTSDKLLEGEGRQYQSLVIIGGGVIGVEFASIYAALGCKVTIIEAQPRLLPTMDREIGQNLSMILKKRGVEIYTGAGVQRIAKTAAGLACAFSVKDKPQTAEAEGVLVAVGRSANVQGLFADGFTPDIQRGIVVDENFATSVPGIYAIGDVVHGGMQLAHVASAQGTNAIAHMAGEAPEIDLGVVPACVYTDPEIACVGITADEAKAQGIPVKAGKFNMGALGKTMIQAAPRSFIKVVAHADTGVLLGAQLMCPRATDLVSEFATAIVAKLTAKQLASVIRPHPTFAEGITEVAEDVLGLAVHAMPKHRPG